MTRRQRPSLPAVLGLGVLVTVSTAACAPAHSGAAAVVGDTRISTAEVQGSARAVIAEKAAASTDAAAGTASTGTRTDQDGVVQREQLRRKVLGVVAAEAAREKGVSVTPGDVDARIAAVVKAAGQQGLTEQMVQAEIAPKDLKAFVHDLVLEEKLAEALVPGAADDQAVRDKRSQALGAAFAQTARRLGVSVNPRFGSWDPTKVEIAAPGLLAGPQGDSSLRS